MGRYLTIEEFSLYKNISVDEVFKNIVNGTYKDIHKYENRRDYIFVDDLEQIETETTEETPKEENKTATNQEKKEVNTEERQNTRIIISSDELERLKKELEELKEQLKEKDEKIYTLTMKMTETTEQLIEITKQSQKIISESHLLMAIDKNQEEQSINAETPIERTEEQEQRHTPKQSLITRFKNLFR